jgi:hypothetical protein
VTPCSSWLNSITELQKRVALSAPSPTRRRRRPGRWTSRWKRFSTSHISVAIRLRIVRAFSRARSMHSEIEFGFSCEKSRWFETLSSSAVSSAKAERSPTMSSSAAQWRMRRASASGVEPIVSVWLNVTSVTRAVCSARST